MSKFCPTCDNIMFPDLSSGELRFVCRSCGTGVDGTDADVLLGEIPIPGLEGTSQQLMINNAPADVTNKLIDKKCPRCKEWLTFMYVKYEEMRPVEVCGCGYVKWLS